MGNICITGNVHIHRHGVDVAFFLHSIFVWGQLQYYYYYKGAIRIGNLFSIELLSYQLLLFMLQMTDMNLCSELIAVNRHLSKSGTASNRCFGTVHEDWKHQRSGRSSASGCRCPVCERTEQYPDTSRVQHVGLSGDKTAPSARYQSGNNNVAQLYHCFYLISSRSVECGWRFARISLL